jgi:hypothetical protein
MCLLSQYHKAVTAKNTHCHIRKDPEAYLPGKPCNSLDEPISQFNASGSIEIIDQLISDVCQRAESRLLREIVQMRMMIAAKEETVLAQNCLNRKIQWYVKQLLLSFGPHGPYQSYIVFNMFKDVQHQEQIKTSVALVFSYVAQAKAKVFVASVRAHGQRVRRNVVAPADTVRREMGLQFRQH